MHRLLFSLLFLGFCSFSSAQNLDFSKIGKPSIRILGKPSITVDIVPITIAVGDQKYICDKPINSNTDFSGNKISISDTILITNIYSCSLQDATLEVSDEIRSYTVEKGIFLKHRIVLTPSGKIVQDCTVTIPFSHTNSQVFLPMKNGVGLKESIDGKQQEWLYYMAGAQPASPASLLAIPAIDLFSNDSHESKENSRLLIASDCYYSTLFRIHSATVEMEWAFEASKIPFEKPIDRTFYQIVHSGDEEEALELFHKTLFMLPGPAWLHDIAMIGYDYLSDGGQGWFKDIDWLTANLPPEDRPRVCLALHGWYDLLGRYTYDSQKQALDKEWTAFPNAPNCDKKIFPNSVSVKMSQEELIRRLRYAQDRGFRVVLYFADGLAICEGAKKEFSPEKILYSGGWQGPDTLGPTHIMNPLHPAVRQFFLGYMDALLKTYGQYLDGFVWDETFHADPSNYGNEHAPGYASTGMMTLTQQLTEKVRRYRNECAFLASDCIGANGWFYKAPYSLMADGTYQDSHCQPAAWPYGIFPNYKNVLWSCNWNPVTHFDWTEIGVRQYQTPVVFTNGWNDDMGFYEMPAETAQKFIQLFQERKQHGTRLQWLKP